MHETRRLLLMGMALTLLGCSVAQWFGAASAPRGAQPDPLYLTATYFARQAAPAATESPCAYRWASRPAPELNAPLQTALAAGGFTVESVSVSLFGEDCIDGVTGVVRSFGAMETDYTIRLSADGVNADDEEAVGEYVAAFLGVFNGLVNERNAPVAASISLQVVQNGIVIRHLTFTGRQAISALDQHLTGAALLRALESTS